VPREIGLLAFAGIAIGLPLTLSGTRLVSNMFDGLSGTAPFSLIGATALPLFAEMAAGYLPARRASRVEPVIALRDE
jgi:ABC-type antimicrobial peptide transport system permease subunit